MCHTRHHYRRQSVAGEVSRQSFMARPPEERIADDDRERASRASRASTCGRSCS